MTRKVIIVFSLIVTFFALDYAFSLFLKKGLDKYFGLDSNAELLLLGHSHLMLATDKEMLEDSLGVKVAKYCREGVNPLVREKMIRHYLSIPGNDSLKVVVYGVDQYMFNPTGLSENVYKLFYPFMDNEEINNFIKDNADYQDYWSHKIIKSSGYSDVLINSSLRGWANNWSNYKIGSIDIDAIRGGDKGKQLREIQFDPELKKAFESTLSFLTSKGIKVVLLNTPIIREYNEQTPEKRNEIISYFQSLANSSDLIYYWDLNPDYSERYELFFDPIHINSAGQPIMTHEIIELYKQNFK